LAERKNFIKKVAQEVQEDSYSCMPPLECEDGTLLTPEKESTSVKTSAEPTATVEIDNTADPDVESIEHFVIKKEAEKKQATPSVSPVRSTSSLEGKDVPKFVSPPRKTMKEIEEEIARNTAQHDAAVSPTGGAGGGSKLSKRGAAGGASADKDAADKDKSGSDAATKRKRPVVVVSNINPGTVTRLIRMFVIIALAAYKGYYIVQHNNSMQDLSSISAMESSFKTGAFAPGQVSSRPPLRLIVWSSLLLVLINFCFVLFCWVFYFPTRLKQTSGPQWSAKLMSSAMSLLEVLPMLSCYSSRSMRIKILLVSARRAAAEPQPLAPPLVPGVSGRCTEWLPPLSPVLLLLGSLTGWLQC
jgi:hypothetical protein